MCLLLKLLKEESSIKGAEGLKSCERKTMRQDLGFVLLPKSGGKNWTKLAVYQSKLDDRYDYWAVNISCFYFSLVRPLSTFP